MFCDSYRSHKEKHKHCIIGDKHKSKCQLVKSENVPSLLISWTAYQGKKSEKKREILNVQPFAFGDEAKSIFEKR
jgi:hypothetical protein